MKGEVEISTIKKVAPDAASGTVTLYRRELSITGQSKESSPLGLEGLGVKETRLRSQTVHVTGCGKSLGRYQTDDMLEYWNAKDKDFRAKVATVLCAEANTKKAAARNHANVAKTAPPAATANGSLSEYVNSLFGFRLVYPSHVLYPQGESTNGDGQVFSSPNGDFRLTVWGERKQSDESVQEMFAFESRGLQRSNKMMVVTFKQHRDNWFVVSGVLGGQGVYRRTLVSSDHIVRMEMLWQQSDTDKWRPTIEAVKLRATNE